MGWCCEKGKERLSVFIAKIDNEDIEVSISQCQECKTVFIEHGFPKKKTKGE